MEVGEKADPEVYRFQPSDTFLASSRSLPDDPGAKVNKIRRTVDDAMAVDGPECSGSGAGVPVPRRTICVLDVSLLCACAKTYQAKRSKTANPVAPLFCRFVIMAYPRLKPRLRQTC
jgi:hypothetical protein